MSHSTTMAGTLEAGSRVASTTMPGRAAAEARWILRAGFTVAPILAGLDKFFGLLTNWEQYLAPQVTGLLGGGAHGFMMIVGVVEIAAGIGVALKPRVFSYVVAAWLWGIILNLLLIPGFFDVALRDLGLSLGALALARLSQDDDRRPATDALPY